ncbi:MAG: hypothetical protein NTW82_02555 [Bacteroidia bacterium]|nr:hypothetical protein [Bacteroidia bacterium]
MSPLFSFTKSDAWKGTVKKTKRFFKWLLFLIVLFLGIFIYWKYFYTYSEGYRAGLLQKFSSKGTFFKTYEGEMILSSVASTRDIALASEKFLFTVTNKSLTRQFDTLQGDNVIVHYRQKNGAVFWRGDSKYLVDSIKVKN